jgi:hypothetical protein
MKHFLLFTSTIILLFSCVYENEEDAYYSPPGNQKNTLDSGLIAHFCFQNSLIDSSTNNVTGTFHGTQVFGDFSKGNKAIVFNGTDNYFEIPVGNHDTIAISLFFKTDGALDALQKPYILDYGKDALALNLDAVSGGTYMTVNNQTLNDPSENWISSFEGWNNLYIEAILSAKQFRVIYNSGIKTDLVISSVSSGTMTLNSESIIIGCNSSGTSAGNYFKGLIDDIRIYNRKLNNTELHQISKVLP